jgi:osmotically-inducible protein OsmY
MTPDRKLQEDVLAALEWEPGIDASHIGVSVVDGVVTMHGLVPTFRQKWLAERAARHSYGVRAVANDLEIAPGDDAAHSDAAIAAAAANALEWESGVPDGCVQATVRHGWVTLTGSVPWTFQRTAAERAVLRLAGVKGVANSVIVRPQKPLA